VDKTSRQIKENSKQVWGASPAGSSYAAGYEKGTKEFFEAVLAQRATQECLWMDEIVNFDRWRGKKVLEIGCGAGYDAYSFYTHGAMYTGIDITPDNPIIARKHLAHFGYTADIRELDVEHMQFVGEFDYVFSFGVLHHVFDLEKALKTINKALKMSGEVQIIVYNKNSIFYYLHIVLFDWILRGKFLKMSLEDRISLIEYTTSSAKPLVRLYTKKSLNRILQQAGFDVIENHIRKLETADLPMFPLSKFIYKYIPQAVLDSLGKFFGWYVSARAIKIKEA